MGKKAIIYCASILGILIVSIVVAISFLYKDDGCDLEKTEEMLNAQASAAHPLLNAVPSDAIMIMNGTGLKKTLSVLSDSTMLFAGFFSGESATFRSFLKNMADMSSGGKINAVKNSDICISMHYSGSMVPLLVLDAGRTVQDSTGAAHRIARLAEEYKLFSSIKTVDESASSPLRGKALLLLSPSESLVQSAERHIGRTVSALESKELAEVAANLRGEICIFIDHNHCDRIANYSFAKKYSSEVKFLKNYAAWSGLVVNDIKNGTISVSGMSATAETVSDFANVFSGLKPGTSSAAMILPSVTRSMNSLQIESFQNYIEAYKKYLDASNQMDKFNNISASVKKKTGVLPDHWASSIGVKEAVSAVISDNDTLSGVVLLRVSKPDVRLLFGRNAPENAKDMKSVTGKFIVCPYYACPELLFGSKYAVSDSTAVFANGWLVFGGKKTLDMFVSPKSSKRLGAFLKECGQDGILKSEGTVFQSYFAVTGAVGQEMFRPAFAKDVARMTIDAAFCPVYVSVTPGERHDVSMTVGRVQESGMPDVLPAALRDTVVNVPKGPFKVKNSGTGKTNLLSQQKNNYIVLKETEGKGLWTIPFNSPICGYVENVDYFANGKIQFLFASGSKLYLLDRLGRFVKPFPVEVGKEILLGPAAYDFTGAHGYTAVVLHNDNTIGIYDLHGKPKSFWTGAKVKGTIKCLPELLEFKGKKYWIVRTSSGAYIVDFNGGEPLTPSDGNKVIRTDSRINIKDAVISAESVDGKERTYKLGK